jgi:regulatory protein SWI6
MSKKQSIIDELHSQLRDASGELGERRRRIEALQSEVNDLEARKLKINNLMRAYEDERAKLSQLQAQIGQMSNEETMQLGDADSSLLIAPNASEIISKLNLPQSQHQPLVLPPNDRQILSSSLPPLHILKARFNAYKSNNLALETQVQDLQSKNSELAGKYRTIISLCTGAKEDKVDALLENLLRAVDSEPNDVELARVREFLGRVEGI